MPAPTLSWLPRMIVAAGQLTDAIDHRIRIGAVADQIAEHEDRIVRAGLGQRRFERLEIGVHVADDEVFHNSARVQKSTHSSNRPTTSATGRVASIRTCAWA